MVIGKPERWEGAVPLRMHSACLTGDLFGSLRCDCGEQLRNAVADIQSMGGGVLLYLAQEGRGIGLANKLRAYTLQDGGLDTVDADQMLGFGDDERQYAVAVDMLNALDINQSAAADQQPVKNRGAAPRRYRGGGTPSTVWQCHRPQPTLSQCQGNPRWTLVGRCLKRPALNPNVAGQGASRW
ncbi:hypothetical protein HSBAA_15530 [Vreelandella sulfidaeris]|uniref:GTP cyclohydrolase II domain-containing protein n=1 Tax=Vreelandella sulfidaeris TaxID=115553 RepID=A0A455U3R7_9GAMM|nr:hypothetical protein HSBAA_15530 [Halomonas sulfidaeris]